MCEPIGLKYLRQTLNSVDFSIIFSHNCFVSPYEDSAFLKGAFSSTGKLSGLPINSTRRRKNQII